MEIVNIVVTGVVVVTALPLLAYGIVVGTGNLTMWYARWRVERLMVELQELKNDLQVPTLELKSKGC